MDSGAKQTDRKLLNSSRVRKAYPPSFEAIIPRCNDGAVPSKISCASGFAEPNTPSHIIPSRIRRNYAQYDGSRTVFACCVTALALPPIFGFTWQNTSPIYTTLPLTKRSTGKPHGPNAVAKHLIFPPSCNSLSTNACIIITPPIVFPVRKNPWDTGSALRITSAIHSVFISSPIKQTR